MSFDPAHHQETVEALCAGVEDLRTCLGRLPGALDGVPVPPTVRDVVVWCLDQLEEIGTALLGVVVEVLRGVDAPLRFFDAAARWTAVRGCATGVVGALDPALLPATGRWHGDAADAYARASTPQVAAAARIGLIASQVSSTLTQGALDGVAFYLAVEVVLAQLLATLAAALAAAGTVVLSPVALGLCVEEAAVTPAMLGAALTGLVSSMALQAAQLVALRGEAVDRSAFPGGRWPDAATDRYADATVTDDDADWSPAH